MRIETAANIQGYSTPRPNNSKKAILPNTERMPKKDNVKFEEDTVSLTSQIRNQKKSDEKNKNELDKIDKSILTENRLIHSQRNYDYYINDNEDLAIKVIDKNSGNLIKEIPIKKQQNLKESIKKIISDI